MSDYDVVIVGGAVMGSATAYHIKRLDPAADVAVIERDPTYRKSSSLLCDGNVRIQFNLEENIRISQYGFEVLDRFAETMAIGSYRPEAWARRQGNLFLADEAHREEALAGRRTQNSLGCDVSWLEASEIEARWPIYAGSTHVGGTFGPGDGGVDPGAVIQGYRRNAAAMGVEYIKEEVASLARSDGGIEGVLLAGGIALRAPIVINCAGAWSPALLAGIGVAIPVEPVMRSVFVVKTPLDTAGVPSVFLPSGVYALPEADGSFLIGWSQPDDPVGFEFVTHRSRFHDLIWPELVHSLPAFDRLEVMRSWAGLYAVNTFDGNAIVGEWPGVRGLYVCTGFSGHGFQQCHAVGRYLAELVTGSDVSLDLGRLGPQRILDGKPLYEHAGRLI